MVRCEHGECGDGVIDVASSADIPYTNATVHFRIRSYGGDLVGDYATTDVFSVDNRVRGDLNQVADVSGITVAPPLTLS